MWRFTFGKQRNSNASMKSRSSLAHKVHNHKMGQIVSKTSNEIVIIVIMSIIMIDLKDSEMQIDTSGFGVSLTNMHV